MPRTWARRSAVFGPTALDAWIRSLLTGSAAAVPTMNARADIAGLVCAFHRVLPSQADAERFSKAKSLAAMRDLGLLLGSIKRHGAEPVEAVRQAGGVLLLLGRSSGMVPRDTIYHYGPWNASEHRQRMYTGSPQEDTLIRSVRLALPQVEAALSLLVGLRESALEDPAFAITCLQVTRHLTAMVEAIDLVRKHVSPEYFATVLRPYFEDIRIAGSTYLGPAAAHIPLYLVDHVLWSADHSDSAYWRLQEETATYSPPHWRELLAAWTGRSVL